MGSGFKSCVAVSAKLSARQGWLAKACVPAGMGVAEDLAFMSALCIPLPRGPCRRAQMGVAASSAGHPVLRSPDSPFQEPGFLCLGPVSFEGLGLCIGGS